jgi:hypothetical protein
VHEALRRRADNDVVDFLLAAVIDYHCAAIQTAPLCEKVPDLAANAQAPQFIHIGIQEQRVVRSPNGLGEQDDLGRTALHHVVERAKHAFLENGDPSQHDAALPLLEMLLRAHPES